MAEWYESDPVVSAAPAAPNPQGNWWDADPVASSAAEAKKISADTRARGPLNAMARGLVDGIPIAGPTLLGAIDSVDAGARALANDTRYSDEKAGAGKYDADLSAAHPYAHLAGEIGGGIVGTAPLIAAAPAAFGVSAAALPARMLASAASGGALGGVDAAARSGGDMDSIKTGAGLGLALGAAGPAIGAGVGKAVNMATGGAPGMNLMHEAARGLSEGDLAAAQALRETAAAQGVPLSVGEAANAASGGRAGRLSQMERVAANSGGEGQRIASDFYAARPDQVTNAGQRALQELTPQGMPRPTDLAFDAQAAAQRGLSQTPQGMALQSALEAAGPRVTPEQAGQAIQGDLRSTLDAREAARAAQAAQDYRAARAAPETVGMKGPAVTVERPGEPVVTQAQYTRPQFEPGAPRPVDPLNQAEQAAGAGPESLGRFVARNGGLRLDGEAAATDLHRFNVPGAGNVARPNGKGIDDFWREHLIANGYLRPDPDGGAARDITSELLRKLQNEQRGLPSYPIGTQPQQAGRAASGAQADEFANAMSLADSRFQEDLARAGIDPAGIHPEVRSRALGAMIRGTHPDPLDAYEAVVGGMREQPAPYVRNTTVQEQIPTTRFGQVDPRPALAAVTEQSRAAKGDVRGALSGIERDLYEPGGQQLDMSVQGLLHARERLDFSLRQAQEVGDATKVRDLQIARSALDGQLKQVPEVATADANFAANSRPLEPFGGNGPLAQVTRREGNAPTGRLTTPAEQVPGMLSGPTAAREATTNGTAATREALAGRVQTQILDGATSNGTVSADALRSGLLQHEDVLRQFPEVGERLNAIATARDGMARVEASPLGQIANRPDVRAATNALFPQTPGLSHHVEAGEAMRALVRNDPRAAESLARTHLETMFSDMTQGRRGLESQYGGAAFGSAVLDHPERARTIEAVMKALPNGETRWSAFRTLMETMKATGHRPQKGSDTAFNQAIQKELASGKTPFGEALSNALAGGSAGAFAGGPSGGIAGLALGAKHGIGDAMARARMMRNGEAIARLMYDPAALPDLRALAKSPVGSRNADLFTTRLLARGSAGVETPLRQPTFH